MTTILVTGGAGFIGSNYIRNRLSRGSDERIINVDLLTYAGNLENLRDVEDDPRYRFVKADIADGAARDAAGNLSSAADQFTIVSDRTPPVLLSFVRQDPVGSPTFERTLTFRATFGEDVTGVDADLDIDCLLYTSPSPRDS